MVLSPGRTEPIEKYFEVVDSLNRRGFCVLVHDWRGQGLSMRMLADRTLGHAQGYKPFLSDYAALLAAFETRLPKPWIAMGHSMGGCLTLLALAMQERRFSGCILSAPMLGLVVPGVPTGLAKIVARLLVTLGLGGLPVPGRRQGEPAPFEGNILTHDPQRYARNEAQLVACPDLILGPPTWGWLDFALTAVGILQDGPGATRIATPLSVLAAGDEALVDNRGSALVAARIPGARYQVVPGAHHEILQERDDIQAPFWREFEDLLVRSGV